jgi:hypothetical protein
MTTNTAGTTARELPTQQIHYLRKTVSFDTAGISSGVAFPNPLPAGSQILFATINITTAFAGGTPVLSVGQNSATYNDIIASTDIVEATAASTMVLRGADLTFATDKAIYALLTNVGTGTTGEAVIVIAYVPDNDA